MTPMHLEGGQMDQEIEQFAQRKVHSHERFTALVHMMGRSTAATVCVKNGLKRHYFAAQIFSDCFFISNYSSSQTNLSCGSFEERPLLFKFILYPQHQFSWSEIGNETNAGPQYLDEYWWWENESTHVFTLLFEAGRTLKTATSEALLREWNSERHRYLHFR